MLHAHLWPDTAALRDQRLWIAGCDVAAVARAHGTPAYLLDEATVRTTAAAFQAALAAYPGPTAIHYASKALLNTALVQLMASCGLGLDVVSGGELAIARQAGADLGHVHLHGNATPPAELRQAVAWGVGRVMVDNLDQLRALAAGAAELGRRQPIMLRVAPGIAAGGHAHIQTGAADAKFGLRLDDGSAHAAARLALAEPALELVGLHAHIGSQVRDFAALRAAVERLLALAAELRGQLGWTASEISPGGGLAVPALPAEAPVSLAAYGSTLVAAMVEGCARHDLPLPRLVIEPGRSLVARAIVAVYTVTGRKAVPGGRPFLHIDGGMGDNPRPALYGAAYHGLLVERAAAEPAGPQRIAGRFCESGDILIDELQLPAAEPGDLLAVPVAGAYTLSMASSYNGIGRPPLLLLRAGQAYVIQRRETVADLTARDLPLPA